ncbi:MAG: methylmalonyl-CoA mutase family protein [Bacteroidia bacterium]
MQETFPLPPPDLWETLIRKELPPTKSYEDLFQKIGNYIRKPYYTRQDVPDWPHCQPLFHQKNWYIAQPFDDETLARKAVAEGVEVMLLEGNFSWDFAREKRVILAPDAAPELRTYYPNSYVLSKWGEPAPSQDYVLMAPEVFSPLPLLVKWLKEKVQLAEKMPSAILFSLTADFFASIALLRAFHLLMKHNCIPRLNIWSQPNPIFLAHEQQEDNLLFLTTFALSAVLGGSQVLFLPPYQTPRNADAYRLSRNIGHILKYEVPYLAPVEDPLHGSFYVENFTQALYQEALC